MEKTTLIEFFKKGIKEQNELLMKYGISFIQIDSYRLIGRKLRR